MHFLLLLKFLNLLSLLEEGSDNRVWIPLKDGEFLVSSFFHSLMHSSSTSSTWGCLWKIKAPPRVLASAWLALCGRILTMDNLRRKVIVVNACPFCLVDEESIDHLLNCKVVWKVWCSFLREFGCSWTFRRSIGELFDADLSEVHGYLPYAPLKEGYCGESLL